MGNSTLVDGQPRLYPSTNELTQNGPTPILYDTAGNQTDDGTFTYQYDVDNRLRTVARKSDGMTVAVYSYDALGRRARAVVTNSGTLNGTTDSHSGESNVVEEHDGADVVVQQHVYGAEHSDSVVAEGPSGAIGSGGSSSHEVGNEITGDYQLDESARGDAGGVADLVVVDRNLYGDGTATGTGDQRLYYHADALGSTRALTDAATGAVVEGYLYGAYGRQTVVTAGGERADRVRRRRRVHPRRVEHGWQPVPVRRPPARRRDGAV